MNKHVPADERPSFAARRADALGVLAESFIKNGGAPMNGGERHQIVVHVDAETLRDGTAGQCEVEDGTSVPAETARRLEHDERDIYIDKKTATARWRGERMDYGIAVESLVAKWRRGRDVPAETQP